ncbi:MAG: threonine--tRNA ligase [Waddliaceae bacterium]|nr:threonine--tRNA ligase [Waddliaceae bacterium]
MIIVIDEKQKVELEEGSNGWDLAKELGLTGPDQALAVSVNGTTYDLTHILQDGDQVKFWDFASKEGKEVFWHTSAHILAQAILRIWPEAKPTIGPPIENGFYYDFANLKISDADFPKIEKEMKKICKENHRPQREVLENKAAAIEAFKGNPYKCHLIEGFPAEEEVSAYRQGEFYDLCRGPHLSTLSKVKALKVLKTSGAYWLGDSQNEMLTRVYAITFPNKEELQTYLHRLEEAKKRDHKIIGPKLDLFSLREEAPGMPFIHHKGMHVWNTLIDFWRELHSKNQYEEIKTPIMMTRDLWETSGHWTNYRENMFTSTIEEREFAIKPMNCPGCILYYARDVRSYRELPLRIGEIGLVHRYEPSGALSGLFRVRSFHQDDAHIFMKPDDIENEIVGVLNLVEEIYGAFGLEYFFELSTRPESGTIGTDEDWETATQGLQRALDRTERKYTINEGDGAFYGPKIDLHIRDALGRTWQCGTIQLDMALPERFDIHYTAADGTRPRPIMIHRAIFGSMERFFGILIEHFSGRFPLWLSPLHVRVVTVADRHADHAYEVKRKLSAAGLICDVDDSSESVGKKIRSAQLSQINYMLTVGDTEAENGTASLRTRDNVVHREIQLDQFIQALVKERSSRSLESPYAKNA